MAPKKEDAIEKKAPAELARPSFIPKSGEGTEHITQRDITIPRIAIAQALSPQLTEGEKFIEDLKQGDMFNTETDEILGRGPLSFFILKADPPRYIQFRPRTEGGGVLDLEVPANDPRTRFTTDGDGNRVKPAATMFYDYFIVLADRFGQGSALEQMIGLSMKSSQLKKARGLNLLIASRSAPLYAGRYVIRTKPEKNALGSFYNFDVDNDGWCSEAQLPILKALSDQLRRSNAKMSREGQELEDDSFNPAEM